MTYPYNSMKRPGPPSCRYMDLLDDETINQLPVATTGTAYGKSFIPPKNCSFGMILRFLSAGSVNVKVELESGLALPTTEGSADASWGVGDLVSSAITSTVTQALVAAPVVAPYCRLKLTGISGNDAATYLAACALTFEKNL